VLDDPEVAGVQHVAPPLRLDRTPLVAPGRAPRLGADTDAVLRDVLGVGPAEIARLRADGVLR